MSTPYIPGVEMGTSLEGNIELSLSDLVKINVGLDNEFDCNTISRMTVSDFGDECFLIDNVLTATECQQVIHVAEGEKCGFQDICVRDDYRSNKRISIQSDELATRLWERIKPEVKDVVIQDDPHAHHVHGPPFLMKGQWIPIGLNNIFRLCRYTPGGHFAPHFDGHYDRAPDERSLKTFMIYLNGDFSGGSTNFVDESQTLYKDEKTGKYCAEEKNILCRIRPQTGQAIIFNHHRLHEGAILQDGVKYILRTDVMFRNVSQQLSDNYTKAVLLLQQAETLENGGKCMEAVEAYRKAFKLAPELESST